MHIEKNTVKNKGGNKKEAAKKNTLLSNFIVFKRETGFDF